MNETVAKAWIADLKANPDKQGTHVLFDGRGHYDPLGRLVVVLGLSFTKHPRIRDRWEIHGTSAATFLSPHAMKLAGLRDARGEFTLGGKRSSIAIMADQHGAKFKDIADFIEKHWEIL
jgi:hypothetical protein